MNKYLKNLNRLEFIVTYNCSGKCKHCSVGDDKPAGVFLDKKMAETVVYDIASMYDLESVMTFGGEPLLNAECVCAIHSAATEMKISKRQLITNGFFSKDVDKIKSVVYRLAESGVNDILLSVDAFHQETIPVDAVECFAEEVLKLNLPVRISPAWLVSKNHDNLYNEQTREIVNKFKQLGIAEGEGNVIFPEGNAVKYLSEYFKDKEFVNPYIEDPSNLQSISVEPDGSMLGRSLYKESIFEILDEYKP